MLKRFYIRFGFLVILFTLCFSVITSAATKWVWIESNDKFGKFIAPETLVINRGNTGKLNNIEIWGKTAYTYEGAKIELASYESEGIAYINPANLSYSLMKLKIYPKSGIIERQKVAFYNKEGELLASPEKLYRTSIYYKDYYAPFFYYTLDQIANNHEYETYKNSGFLIYNNSGTRITVDLMSMRELGDCIDIYEGYSGNEAYTVERLFYKKDSLNYSYGLVYGYDKGTGYETEDLFPSMKTDFVIPDSMGHQIRTDILNYFNAHKEWVNRYNVGVYVAS